MQHKLLIFIESPNIFHWKSVKKSKMGVVLRAKSGPMLWKNKETGIINQLFSNFAWGILLKARSCDYRNTWVKIEGRNSKKYHIWRKLGLNFCPPFWVKNSKTWLFLRFLTIFLKIEVFNSHSLLTHYAN